MFLGQITLSEVTPRIISEDSSKFPSISKIICGKSEAKQIFFVCLLFPDILTGMLIQEL